MATMMSEIASREEAIATTRAPAALTDRGTAAARLSEFQDALAALDTADRAWFAHWLTALLVDACEGELTS